MNREPDSTLAVTKPCPKDGVHLYQCGWSAQLGLDVSHLKSRATDARDEDHRRLQAKIGELLMETELLYAKVDQLEASGPLARRRSTR